MVDSNTSPPRRTRSAIRETETAVPVRRSRRKACEPHHAVRGIQMHDLVWNLLRHVQAG